jgi:YD repeat-containing protein
VQFFGRTLSLVIAGVTVSATSLVSAQVSPPQRHDAKSPTGVSFRGGGFAFEEEDLAIGDETNGLRLVRSYNSAADGLSDPYVAAVGWTQSFNIYITVQPLPQHPDVMLPPNYYGRCVYNIVGGAGAVGFVYTGSNPPGTTSCGGAQVGTYQPITPAGSKLELITATQNYFRYTGADGSIINFTPGVAGKALNWTKPDGTRLDFTYSGGTSGALKSVFSNRGWAILFESATKICAVNLAQTYVSPTSPCPSGAQAVTYTYATGTYSTSWKLMTSATKGGNTRSYQYAANDHVNCIKDPGQSTCRIQNTYTACPEDPYFPPVQPGVRLRDYVTSQTDGAGRTYNYTYSVNGCPQWQSNTDPDYRSFDYVSTTMSETGVPGAIVAITDTASQITSLTDPLGRNSQFVYDGSSLYDYESGDLVETILPEGNKTYFLKDARGNLTSGVTVAKAGSGLANLTQGAIYPPTCSNVMTCNKPTSTTDARGQMTDYIYDAAHGGVLRTIGPVDANGVRPETRSSYVQRTARLKNSAGGYSASSYPVWLLSEQRSCRTSPTVSGACVGGTADEVVTTFEYGPDSGPNNLLLRGVAVTTDGQTLRTCFSYDAYGRRISETQPLAGLASCP